jgi:hypothetical protein
MDGLLGLGTIVLSTGVGLGFSMSAVWLILNLGMRR